MATLPKSQIDPGLPLQDPAMLAWLRQYGLGVPQAGNTSPIMERLMQTTADPPAGLGDLPSQFYAPGYIPRRSAPSRIDYNPMGFPEEASLQGGEGSDTLAGAGGKMATMATQRPAQMQGARRNKPPPPALTDAIAYAVGRTYGPGYSFQVRSGIVDEKKGTSGASSSGRHIMDGPGAADVRIFDPQGNQLAGEALTPLAQNWVSNFGSIGVNREASETNAHGWTHMDLVNQPGKGQGYVWSYGGFAPGAKEKIAGWIGKKEWVDGQPADEVATALYDAADATRASSVRKAPPRSGVLVSLFGRGELGTAPAAAADPAVAIQETPVSPEQVAAIQASAATAADAAWGPQQTAALALDGMDEAPPAQQAIDDMLTGQSAEQVLAGGPRPDPRRVAPATGPIAPDAGSFARTVADVLDEGPNLDPRRIAPGTGPVPANMGAMVSPEDVLAAGPNLRPGGAPDAASVPDPTISPMRPAVGGPNDRRPQPPTPPSRAQGIPDPRMRPDPASLPQRGFPAAYGEQPQPDVMTDDRRQRILADLLELEQRDPPAADLVGDMSAAMGGPPSRAGDLSAAMGDAPPPTNLTPASQPISIDPSFGVGYRVQRDADRMAAEQDARMAQFDRDMQADRVIAAADYYQPQNIMQPPSQPPTPRALQEARTKDDAYSLPPDFSVASEPAPIITAGPPPSAMGPIGNTISPDNDRGAGRQPFVDANRTPVSVDRSEPAWLDIPDPTPPGLQSPPVADWRDQFNLSFSPGGPGMIADLTPPQAPAPSATPPPSNPFDALMGPGAAMGAMPFNEASQGVGAPDFSNASDASWWNGAPTGDLGLESIPPKTAAMADALDEAPPNPGETLADQALAQAYASPGASRFIDYGLKTPYTQAAANAQVYQPAGPTGGIDIRSPAARTLSEEAPPPASSSAPMFAQPPAPAGGRLGPVPGSGPFGALFGGAGGGLMGKIGANWAGPQWTGTVTQGSGPYMYDSGMGTNDWWSGNTDAMGGSTGLSWTGSDGRTITAYSNDGGQTYTHGYGPGV